MSKGMPIGASMTYYGYRIMREGEEEYSVSIYADDLEAAKEVIKRCLDTGIIEWPVEVSGRKKKEVKNELPGMD